jgi:hypothetical protein
MATANTVITKGVNGADVYTEAGVGNALVPLFTMLVRSRHETIRESLNKMLTSAEACARLGRDLFTMAFQTRDIRGGKGERDLFFHMFLTLAMYYPTAVVSAMLRLVPEYGCWRDMMRLWTMAGTDTYGKNTEWRTRIRGVIDAQIAEQFRKDLAALAEAETSSNAVSLLGKWMPREGGADDFLSLHYAELLFPDIAEVADKRRAYRKACSALNRRLNTAEATMARGEWATITPAHVPGRCMARKKRALLNLVPLHRYTRGSVRVVGGKRYFTKGKLSRGGGSSLEEIRHPENSDRMACRENFVAFGQKVARGEAKVKGANVVMPHELVHEMRSVSTTAEERVLIEGQWRSIREEIQKKGGLRGIVPLCDFSGSMSGIPMEVSIALGILISELADEEFRDRVITFDATPTWVDFAGMTTFAEKVAKASRAPWGTSTNFQAACSLILDTLIENEVPPENAPRDLLVLTDMGFDAACGSGSVSKTKDGWQTHVEMIRASFAKHGYVAPRIIIWNLRAAFKEFHAKAEEEGVVMLSGWSPAILEVLQNGNLSVKTPLDGVRAVLDVARYDAVRVAWDGVQLAPFSA